MGKMFQSSFAILFAALATTCLSVHQDQIVFTENNVEISILPSHNSPAQSFQYPSRRNTTFAFDDIQLHQAVSNISHYSNFNLSGFQIFDPIQSVGDGLFPREDSDCSTSLPNALLGSRAPKGPWPRLIWNPSTDGNSSYFHMLGFSIKAMGYTPRGLVVRMNGYEITDGAIVRAYQLSLMYVRPGYQQVIRLDLTKYGWWPERINALEFWAQTNDRKDWNFCIDDLKVAFAED